MSALDGLTARQRLEGIFEEVSEAAYTNLNLPKNTGKGDGWRDMSRLELYQRTCEEVWEVLQAETEEEMVQEAGDVLVYLSFAIDAKCGQGPLGRRE